MDSSVTDVLLQVHRRRLRTVVHGLKFLRSFATKLDVWSFLPSTKPGYVPDGRRPKYQRQRSLLDCVDDSDYSSYQEALSSFSPASRSASPSSGGTTTSSTPAGAELASDELFDRFIIDFRRRLVNEKKVSVEIPKCRCFAAKVAAPGSTPTPSTTQTCRTPISPESYFNLERQKAAGYICS